MGGAGHIRAARAKISGPDSSKEDKSQIQQGRQCLLGLRMDLAQLCRDALCLYPALTGAGVTLLLVG